MSGTGYMVMGAIVMVLVTLGCGGLQLYLIGKKKSIKEQYHIYE